MLKLSEFSKVTRQNYTYLSYIYIYNIYIDTSIYRYIVYIKSIEFYTTLAKNSILFPNGNKNNTIYKITKNNQTARNISNKGCARASCIIKCYSEKLRENK